MAGPTLTNDQGYGLSAADWDNDGDIDLTVGGNFWRNRLIETAGVYSGTSMCWGLIYNLDDTPYGVISHALPSWLDADRDGVVANTVGTVVARPDRLVHVSGRDRGERAAQRIFVGQEHLF